MNLNADNDHIKIMENKAGDLDAQYQLGCTQLLDKDTLSKGIKTLRSCAEGGGHIKSIFKLGKMYTYGIGVTKDHKIAKDLYMIGARKGNPVCMYNVGNFHLLEDQVGLALDWYGKGRACDAIRTTNLDYVMKFMTLEHLMNLLESRELALDRVKGLEMVLEKKEEIIGALQDKINYRPGGPGYDLAEKHYRSVCQSE